MEVENPKICGERESLWLVCLKPGAGSDLGVPAGTHSCGHCHAGAILLRLHEQAWPTHPREAWAVYFALVAHLGLCLLQEQHPSTLHAPKSGPPTCWHVTSHPHCFLTPSLEDLLFLGLRISCPVKASGFITSTCLSLIWGFFSVRVMFQHLCTYLGEPLSSGLSKAPFPRQ